MAVKALGRLRRTCSTACRNALYYAEHREEEAKRTLAYRSREEYPVQKKGYDAKYYAANSAVIKKKVAQWQTVHRRDDVLFRLKDGLRNRLKAALRKGYKTGSAVRDLGCTISELRAHLEKLFQPGMTWENWSLDGWHIDHIKPLASFDLTDRQQLLQACHYTNLRPLWAADNLVKGDKQEAA